MAQVMLLGPDGYPLESRGVVENDVLNFNNPANWGNVLGLKDDLTGVNVTREKALMLSEFWRGVNLIAGDVARLPLRVWRTQDNKRERDKAHPAYRVLRRKANSETDALTFRKTVMGHVLTEGNGYAYIMRDGAGRVRELIQLDPCLTWPIRRNGILRYFTSINGKDEPINPEDMLHIKGLGYDGLVGYSVIAYAKRSLGEAIASQEYSSRFFSNNARPDIVIEHPATLSREKALQLAESWNRAYRGLNNQHKTAVLEEGMKVNAFSKTAKDSQLLELRQFGRVSVANILGIPPHKLGDSSKVAYNSLEQENQSYLNDCLETWLTTWEMECYEKLLSEAEKAIDSHSIEFDRRGLTQPDLKTRGDFYKIAIESRFMTTNEVRAELGYNPMEESAVEDTPADSTPEDHTDNAAPDDSTRMAAARIAAVEEVLGRVVRRIAARAAKGPRTELTVPEDDQIPVSVLRLSGAMGDGEAERISKQAVVDMAESLRVKLAASPAEQRAEVIKLFERTEPNARAVAVLGVIDNGTQIHKH